MVAALVRSLVTNKADPLVHGYFEHDHPEACARSCYRCLQRYGNRGLHGLLDWRLGLSFLRAMLDVDWYAGLDGNFAGARELVDWPQLAAHAADELVRLNPVSRHVETVGPLGLPVVLEGLAQGGSAYVVVHPFWRLDDGAIDARLNATRAALFGRNVFFVDTFDVARRPVRALSIARTRKPSLP